MLRHTFAVARRLTGLQLSKMDFAGLQDSRHFAGLHESKMDFAGLQGSRMDFALKKTQFVAIDIHPGAKDNTLLVNQADLQKLRWNGFNYMVKEDAKRAKSRGRSQSKSKKAPRKASKSKGRKKSASRKKK